MTFRAKAERTLSRQEDRNIAPDPGELSSITDIRLLVLDIDGTLAGPSGVIGEPVRKAIRAAKHRGVAVAIATGRMHQTALRYHRAIDCALPLISFDGGLIKESATGVVHAHWPLDRAIAAELLDHCRDASWGDRFSVLIHTEDRLYVHKLNPPARALLERSEIKAIEVADARQVLDLAATRFMAVGHDPDDISRLMDTLRGCYGPAELSLARPMQGLLDCSHPTANKGTAVRFLTETLLGLEPHNVMAIGDEFNDLSMLAYAGIGVAMGNAPDAIKAAADWVAPPIELHGVAAAIETWI